jgi:hypothetical protein
MYFGLIRSYFGDVVDNVERFISVGDGWIGGFAHVGVFVGQEYTDHVVLIEKDHDSWYDE